MGGKARALDKIISAESVNRSRNFEFLGARKLIQISKEGRVGGQEDSWSLFSGPTPT